VFRKRTLFERLRNPGGTASYTLEEDTGALLQSVLHNLTRILNARTGQTPAQPDYGIPSPAEVARAYPDSIGSVVKDIRRCIERYEPRLRDVQVIALESVDNQLMLRFQITARLATSKDGKQISVSTVMNPAGHVDLKA
jgi:type VI secretion system protein